MSRDIPWREKKKPKKDTKKSAVVPQVIQPVDVEVVRTQRRKDEGLPKEWPPQAGKAHGAPCLGPAESVAG